MTKIQKLTVEILITDEGIGDLSTAEEVVQDIHEAVALYDAIFMGSRTTDMVEAMPEPTTDNQEVSHA